MVAGRWRTGLGRGGSGETWWQVGLSVGSRRQRWALEVARGSLCPGAGRRAAAAAGRSSWLSEHRLIVRDCSEGGGWGPGDSSASGKGFACECEFEQFWERGEATRRAEKGQMGCAECERHIRQGFEVLVEVSAQSGPEVVAHRGFVFSLGAVFSLSPWHPGHVP